MAKAKKEPTQMDKISKGFEQFIKGKELNTDNKELFEKALKKAATTKSKPKPKK